MFAIGRRRVTVLSRATLESANDVLRNLIRDTMALGGVYGVLYGGQGMLQLLCKACLCWIDLVCWVRFLCLCDCRFLSV